MPKKRALGRGLDILIPQADTTGVASNDLFYCEVNAIRPNPYQPRRHFSEKELNSLAASIKTSGVLQPVMVRAAASGYELIVGERRWRASRIAGLKQIPAIVKDVSSGQMLEMALIENIHREDLNPLEKADAYYRLMKEFDLTQEKVAERVGQDRSTVANFLRIRSLPGEIQDDIVNNTLTMGHARAILGVKSQAQQKAIWKKIVSGSLSVRASEALVQRINAGRKKPPQKKKSSAEAVYFQDLADDLSRALGTKVTIVRRARRGRVEIEFYSNQDLDRLVTLLKAPA
jgi:ParB family chromosome partitioning protein